MIDLVREVMNDVYVDGRVDESGRLILEESDNVGNALALSKVTIRLENVSEHIVYKLDRSVTIAGKEYGTCFPFLSDKSGVRSMCDFIIFYSSIIRPQQINVWVVNLKSRNKGNNRSQLNSGNRFVEFILGKLQDINDSVSIGKTNFVLFSSTLLYKAPVNPYISMRDKPGVVGRGSLHEPKNYPQGVSPALEPI